MDSTTKLDDWERSRVFRKYLETTHVNPSEFAQRIREYAETQVNPAEPNAMSLKCRELICCLTEREMSKEVFATAMKIFSTAEHPLSENYDSA